MGKAIVKKPETAIVSDEDLNEMFGESSLDTSTGLSFNTAKIMRESAQFDMGNDRYVKTLTGHIIFKHRANQWWEIPFDKRGDTDDPMPQCYSIDGVKPCGGTKQQANLCSDCPLDKFGSDPEGRGKACRNTMRMLFIEDNAVLPIIIVAPPTSLNKKGSLQQWLNGVPNDVAAAFNKLDIHTNKGGSVVDYWPAKVELSLEKAEFAGGMSASVLCIKTIDVVTPKNDAAKLQSLYKMMKDANEIYKQEQQSYISSETGSEHEGAGNDDDDDIPF